MWLKEATLSVWTVILMAGVRDIFANNDARRLYDDLLRKRGYSKVIRPVANSSDTLVVHLGLKLAQLIDVDEKNQVLTTNVWLIHEWYDSGLTWNPKEYGDVLEITVPPKNIWLPDVVLYNNADGDYVVTIMTKATLHYTGKVRWEPPVVYKSSCPIDIEFFPFDEQECKFKFGTWTYDGHAVDLDHMWRGEIGATDVIETGINICAFVESVEWDLLRIPAQKTNKYYPCCDAPYPDITFYITIRRKTLFYTVNLLMPCISISFLTTLVFYLPAESGEKMTLCISILLSLTVFFLLLAELIPPTSLVIPLIGKYLMFTMIMITLSIILTVIVLNVHWRSPATHKVPKWAHKVFLDILPRLLIMRPPKVETLTKSSKRSKFRYRLSKLNKWNDSGVGSSRRSQERQDSKRSGYQPRPSIFLSFDNVYGEEPVESLAENQALSDIVEAACQEEEEEEEPIYDNQPRRPRIHISSDVRQAMDGVRYIAKHLREEDEEQKIKNDWKYIALVIDRLFLWIFSVTCIVGTCSICLRAPMLYDTRVPLTSCENNTLL